MQYNKYFFFNLRNIIIHCFCYLMIVTVGTGGGQVVSDWCHWDPDRLGKSYMCKLCGVDWAISE